MAKKLNQHGVVKLSQTSKMGCSSFSLAAGSSCPGSIDLATKEVSEVCKFCYAKSGAYLFKGTKQVRQDNYAAIKSETFVEDFVKVLEGHTKIRLHDSGDIFSVSYAEKIYEIASRTPHVMWWAPTKSFKFKKFDGVFAKLNSLPNFSLRYSADKYDEVLDINQINSAVITEDYDLSANPDVFVCPAPENDGKCGTCTACWNKDIKTVAYKLHGRSALADQKKKKTITLKQVK